MPSTRRLAALRRLARRNGLLIRTMGSGYALVDGEHNWVVADDLDLDGLAEELAVRR